MHAHFCNFSGHLQQLDQAFVNRLLPGANHPKICLLLLLDFPVMSPTVWDVLIDLAFVMNLELLFIYFLNSWLNKTAMRLVWNVADTREPNLYYSQNLQVPTKVQNNCIDDLLRSPYWRTYHHVRFLCLHAI